MAENNRQMGSLIPNIGNLASYPSALQSFALGEMMAFPKKGNAQGTLNITADCEHDGKINLHIV